MMSCIRKFPQLYTLNRLVHDTRRSIYHKILKKNQPTKRNHHQITWRNYPHITRRAFSQITRRNQYQTANYNHHHVNNRLGGSINDLRYHSSIASISPENPLRICVVGAGPSGFYTTKYLIKQFRERYPSDSEKPSLQIDVVDALPTPFGLVRSGVAPDHPEVKSVQNDFTEVANSPEFTFFGNLQIGKQISVADLQLSYHAVVLACGAESDRRLNVPGEDLNGVFSAREFVNWYNGHPECSDCNIPEVLKDPSCEDVVVIGHGNVALDCARILVRSIDELATTDLTKKALEVIRASHVKRVHIIGRRGIAQAAFTMKELRELTRLNGVDLIVNRQELQRGLTTASKEEISTTRAKKRMLALLDGFATEKSITDAISQSTSPKQLILRFLCSPEEFLPVNSDDTKVDRVGAVTFRHVDLEGPVGMQIPKPLESFETISTGLVLKSVGYRSVPLPGVPFDENRGIIPSQESRVLKDEKSLPGLYVTGWLRRGPSGIIGTNILDARQVATTILNDLLESDTERMHPPKQHRPWENQQESSTISWKEWLAIDQSETMQGVTKGKPREKYTTYKELFEAAKTPSDSNT